MAEHKVSKILSISYDPVLLHTRDLILREAGYDVASVLGFAEALELCGNHYDLIVMGHSIPEADKRAIVSELRSKGCNAPVLTLIKPGEATMREAAASVEPEPMLVLDAISKMFATKKLANTD
jgi:DNA-binding response OmpR family regulator